MSSLERKMRKEYMKNASKQIEETKQEFPQDDVEHIKELVKHLHLPIEELMELFPMENDGKPLTKEEYIEAINFIKSVVPPQ